MGEVIGERFLDHQCGITRHQECIETWYAADTGGAALAPHRYSGRRKDGCEGNFRGIVSLRCRLGVGGDDG
jgi:hypothetical protein